MITADQLSKACGCTLQRAANWLQPLGSAMGVFAIDNVARQAAFLAQVAHESGRLQYVREIWGPSPAQLRYEGRKDLGNLRPGDGREFMGRGLIQITGRANYAACRDGLRRYLPSVADFEQSPELLEMPMWAAMSAAWFWASRHLNELADAGEFQTITRRINGGLTGLDDRIALWTGAKAALSN